jgi:hypothetical protein
MLPVILVAVGAYLIGDSVLDDSKKFADGGELDKYTEVNGTFYQKGTPQAVINALENARNNKTRVKIFYGDPETGRDWHEEHDTTGTIGRSTGSIKIPLLISTSRSMGGGAILTKNIVKLRDTNTGRVLYQNEKYKQPSIEIVESDMDGYSHNLIIDGELYSRHKTKRSAELLKSKMMADGGEMAKGGVIGTYRIYPFKTYDRYVLNDANYDLAFTIEGSLDEAIKKAQEYVLVNKLYAAHITKEQYGLPLKMQTILASVSKDNVLNYTLPYADGGMMAKGGFTSSFSGTPDRRRVTKEKGGMMAKGGYVTDLDEVVASSDLKEELKSKMKKGDEIVAFSYTDYGGSFGDKVAIEYFKENHPKNIVFEETAYNGQNGIVFGEVAEDFLEETEDYPLGYEDMESFYYQMQSEQEEKDFKLFLSDIKNLYTIKKDALDWLLENKNGYYSIEPNMVDFSYSELEKELEQEGLIKRKKMAKGGKLVGKQKNLDVNKNGKLDAEDFKMLRGEKMAKGGKVNLIFHGSSKEINMGEFESAAAAKRYVKSSDWKRPYSIKKMAK